MRCRDIAHSERSIRQKEQTRCEPQSKDESRQNFWYTVLHGSWLVCRQQCNCESVIKTQLDVLLASDGRVQCHIVALVTCEVDVPEWYSNAGKHCVGKTRSSKAMAL